MNETLTKENISKLVKDIIMFLQKENMASNDVSIYANNHRYMFYKTDGYTEHRTKYGAYYVSDNEIDVAEIIDYYNKDTVTMTFEGELYHALNYDYDSDIPEKLQDVFDKYGLYYELGDAWNLAAYY